MARIYIVQDRFPDGKRRPTAPVYGSDQTLMAVSCEENVVPCLQMSVYAAYLGQTFDTLHDRRLTDAPANGSSPCAKTAAGCANRINSADACAWFGIAAVAVFLASWTPGKNPANPITVPPPPWTACSSGAAGMGRCGSCWRTSKESRINHGRNIPWTSSKNKKEPP